MVIVYFKNAFIINSIGEALVSHVSLIWPSIYATYRTVSLAKIKAKQVQLLFPQPCPFFSTPILSKCSSAYMKMSVAGTIAWPFQPQFFNWLRLKTLSFHSSYWVGSFQSTQFINKLTDHLRCCTKHSVA